MNSKIKNIFFILVFFIFVSLIIKYYFSEKNILKTNKQRSLFSESFKNKTNNLPLLKNDTNNIIVYIDDLEKFKKKRKKRFWEKLISNKNE